MTDTLDASQIDLLDRDRFTQGIPHEWFTWLRNNAPVHHHEEPDGPGFWVITKHADVIACNRDAGTFSSDPSRGGVVGLEEREISEMEQAQEGGKLMLFMDPPDHTRYRKLVNRGFTPADDRRRWRSTSASSPTASSTRRCRRASPTSWSTSRPSCRSR